MSTRTLTVSILTQFKGLMQLDGSRILNALGMPSYTFEATTLVDSLDQGDNATLIPSHSC